MDDITPMPLPKDSTPFFFTGNPYFIDEPADAQGDGVVEIYLRDQLLVTLKYTSPLHLNLAPIVKGLAPETAAGSSLSSRRLTVQIIKGEQTSIQEFYLFDGAVSRRSFRNYAANGTDVFAARLLNPNGNFFFLPTQTGRVIQLKETELEPLLFVADKESFIEVSDGNETYVKIMFVGIRAVDIADIRQTLARRSRSLSSVFRIRWGKTTACTIVITPAEVCAARYLLRYRNSFGAFERIELTGGLEISPDETDETETKAYDPATDDYTITRPRRPRRTTLTARTGPKTPAETLRLLDALDSDEVYLLGLLPDPIRVIPSADDFKFSALPTGPQSYTLKLQTAEEDSLLAPADETDNQTRIFTNQFSKQFN